MFSPVTSLFPSKCLEASPRDWFKTHKAPPPKVDFGWRDRGMEHAQYWPGAGTFGTKWDDVVVGTGDTAHDAAEDALETAAMSGWDVSEIENPYPEGGFSVRAYVERQANTAARTKYNREDFSTQEDYEAAVEEDALSAIENNELNYYVVLYLKHGPYTEALASRLVQSVLEGISPREWFKKQTALLPPKWPRFKWRGRSERRAFQDRTDWQGNPYRKLIANTRFIDYGHGRYALRLYGTNILTYDRGEITVDVGHYHTMLSRDRLNRFLPNGWSIGTRSYQWYWTNSSWPRGATFKKNIVFFHNGDRITPNGTLIAQSGKYRPDSYHPIAEGRYMDKLAWIKRVEAKQAAFKAAKKRDRELEKLADRTKIPKWKKRWPIH